MDMSKGIELPSSENTLRFKFSNMDYALPYANFYEYKLEGYDKEWLKQTGINEVSYKDLPGDIMSSSCVSRAVKNRCRLWTSMSGNHILLWQAYY